MTLSRRVGLALLASLIASSPAAIACGGGGSGGYRKPARPDQHDHQSGQQPDHQAPTSSQGTGQ